MMGAMKDKNAPRRGWDWEFDEYCSSAGCFQRWPTDLHGANVSCWQV